MNDLYRSRVPYIAEGAPKSSLDDFWDTLTAEQRGGIEAVAMKMWDPDVNSTREHVAEAENKIVLDRFPIAQHLAKRWTGFGGKSTSCRRPPETLVERDAIRLAEESVEDGAGGAAGVRRTVHERTEDGARWLL